jgi:predicted MFS family arabinose efflux permease
MAGCFYINGVSFLAVILALFWIKVNRHSAPHKNNSALKDLRDGLMVIKDNRLILVLVCMVAIVSLFGTSYIILMPIFAKDILKVGIRGLGMLMSSAGIGALVSALILARLGDFKGKGRLLILSSLVFSASLILFSLSRIYALSLVSLVFIGGASVTAIALINTILQTEVSDEFRGRIMSAFMFTFAGIMPFGNLLAGALSEALGVSLTVMLSGILCAVFFIIINILYPEIKSA